MLSGDELQAKRCPWHPARTNPAEEPAASAGATAIALRCGTLNSAKVDGHSCVAGAEDEGQRARNQPLPGRRYLGGWPNHIVAECWIWMGSQL